MYMYMVNKDNIKLQRKLTDRMFNKMNENFVVSKPSRQLTHANSYKNQSRQYSRQDQIPQLYIKKAKSAQSQPKSLLVSMWETQSTTQMFDYENKSLKAKQYRIEQDHDIYIANMEKRYAKCVVTKAMCPNDNTYCGTISKSKGVFYFNPGTQVQCYKVIGNNNNIECSIRVGNLIRIGRMKYFIKELFDGQEVKFKQFQRAGKGKQLNIQSLKSGTCKFCLCDEKDTQDLLISPCNCKGSCAQVHLQCLKQWLANKVSRKSTPCVEFLNYDNFSCQICKQDLPTIMKIDGRSYNMLSQNSKPKDSYVVLEGIPNEKSSTKNNMSIKIIFKEKSSLIIGRGHEADIRLEDVSISRQHCAIKLQNNRIVLVDNNSKFGTLLKIEQGQKINLNQNKIQIARMTLQLTKSQMPQNLKLIENRY